MISGFGHIMDVYSVNNFPSIIEQDFLRSRVPEATAVRRIATSSINWSFLAEHLPPYQKASASALPSKPNQMLMYVSLCPTPKQYTKINCAYDKNLIPVPDLIDNFQKSYDNILSTR
uniref:Uncharacterized protein n=1 Tax=Glossina pallidipes TaxID=7398 RepID=A0A1B0A2P3_GLOPL